MQSVNFGDLPRWEDDDHAAALTILGITSDNARAYFEQNFTSKVLTNKGAAHFTGYFEPEYKGSLTPCSRFKYPLHRLPFGKINFSRAEIETNNVLSGQNLEIAWLENPVDKFFLQVQGSGRIILPDRRKIRVGFAGKNGLPYRSIGKLLVNMGVLRPEVVNPETIREWITSHPDQGCNLMNMNESYIYFKEINHISPELGPIGTAGKPLTALRSVAVDPDYIPLGTPVWVDCARIKRLMIAQDTGSAIKGPGRVDIFFGTGHEAGLAAGKMNDTGRLIALMPVY